MRLISGSLWYWDCFEHGLIPRAVAGHGSIKGAMQLSALELPARHADVPEASLADRRKCGAHVIPPVATTNLSANGVLLNCPC